MAMLEREQFKEMEQPLPGDVIFTSQDMPNGEVVAREIEIGGNKIVLEGLSRIGLSYSGEKSASEDGCVVIKNDKILLAIVVDGGTQVERVPTLDAIGLTGGKYIATKVEQFGRNLNPSLNATTDLKYLNEIIGEDIKLNHPVITFQENNYNTPYGSIAVVKIDTINKTLKVANAGDVFVIAVDDSEKTKLLTIDDVYKKDQQTFEVARRLADKYKVSFRQAMQQRATDHRFIKIQEEMQETMRLGNVGKIRRITGAPNYDVTSSVMIPLEGIVAVYIFTDGGIIPGTTVNTEEGQSAFLRSVESSGLQRLNKEIQRKMLGDPDYELYPRFGTVDDLMIFKISIQ
jgi:hypothetical protein